MSRPFPILFFSNTSIQESYCFHNGLVLEYASYYRNRMIKVGFNCSPPPFFSLSFYIMKRPEQDKQLWSGMQGSVQNAVSRGRTGSVSVAGAYVVPSLVNLLLKPVQCREAVQML